METQARASQTSEATQAPGTNGNGAASTLDKLKRLSLVKAPPKKVLFPEPYTDIDWYLRKGSVSEREGWERENTVRKNGVDRMARENVRANLLIKASVNADGTQMFQPGKESRELINSLPGDLVEYAFDDTIDLWGIRKKDADEIAGGNS